MREWMIGRFGDKANRWKGEKAGYVAIHMWLTKHFDKGGICEGCKTSTASRLEWANVSGKYLRDRSDYKVLCPPCHRKLDLTSTHCKNGHERTEQNTKYRKGWKVCIVCNREAQRRYRNAKAN